jgi:AcrR family transcriptional regulator
VLKPEPGLRARKKADLKRRIADAALQLMRDRSYEEVTIEEIVRRVEVSQPTFYKYYPSKEAVLLEHAMSGFGPLLTAAIERKGSVVERMRGFLREMAKQMTKDRKLWVAIAVSNAYNPVRDPELFEAAAVGTRLLEAAIERAQEQGELTRDFTTRRLASMLEGIVLRLCLEWGADSPRPHALAPSLEDGFEFFIRGAAPK